MSGRVLRTFVTARFAVVLSAVSLAGCTHKTPPGPAPVYRAVPSSSIKSVDWYFDATASLQGFVSPNASGASYIQFVEAMEESLDSLYLPKNVPLQKFRFGTVSETFTEIRDTFKPDFYKVAEGYKDTDLAVVGKALHPDGLTIIVTDLFQSDNHIESFRAALLKKGLGTKFQFGVLALSAGFAGTLYDIPPLGTSMGYTGAHPVYAVLLGPQQQVREFMADVLHRAEMELGKGVVQGALLSSQLATPEIALHELPDRESAPSHVILTEVNPVRERERAIVEESDVPPPFAMPLDLPHIASHPRVVYQTELQFEPFAVLPAGAKTVEAWKLDTHVHVCSPSTSGLFGGLKHVFAFRTSASAGPAADSTAAAGPLAAEALVAPVVKADPCPVADSELLTLPPTVQIKPMPQGSGVVAIVSVDLGNIKDAEDPFKAQEKYIYVVNLKMVPSGQEYDFPAWVRAFSQPPGAKFSGLRTPNLAGFLANMNQSIAQAESPAALDDYLYIQSN